MRKVNINVPNPSSEQVEYYLRAWDELENYHLQEDALDKLFFTLCPGNTDMSDILLKVAALNQYQDFPVWLIENYTEDELRGVLAQLENTTSSTKLTGIAAGIRESHRKAKKTVCVGEIKKTVEAALEKYLNHAGNKIQRDEIRKKESDARDAYIKEKRKHQTVIYLQR